MGGMVTPGREARTSDPTYSASLLAYLGEDITLADNSVIRASVHADRKTEADELSTNFYSVVLYGRIPTANIGTLVARQVVTYREEPYFVPVMQRTGKGWTVFVMELQ